MIELNVKEYCHDCLSFEADVEPPQRLFGDNGCMFQTNTLVSCKYRRRCESIKRYLERACENGDGNRADS